jgi:hypothetical protein
MNAVVSLPSRRFRLQLAATLMDGASLAVIVVAGHIVVLTKLFANFLHCSTATEHAAQKYRWRDILCFKVRVALVFSKIQSLLHILQWRLVRFCLCVGGECHDCLHLFRVC